MAGLLKSRNLAKTLFGLCVFLCFLPVVEARVRHNKWEVKYEYKSPDCYKKLAITINGRSPGPTIDAQQGDTVIVELKNSLSTENFPIHWHGIRQHGTPWADGTDGVTQCTIFPGDTFVYKLVLDRPGTYSYHAHYGMQREAGLYGLIRVSLPDGESEPYSYDYDQSIILTDWYHKNTYEQATGLASIPFVWVGEPQSILIQGRGKFNCITPGVEAGLCNATNPECSPFSLTVVPGKTYRLRIKSLTALSASSFEIEVHNMTVVDGHVRWSVNTVSFGLPNTPYLVALKQNFLHTFEQTPPPEGYDAANYDIFSVQKNVNGTTSNSIFRLKFISTVDIVLQNANPMNPNNSETHPWHLHGHDFWVLGYGTGKFNISTDPQKYNFVNPIMKNSVPVHPHSWTALRFRADNPGVWLFHCHIESQFFLGMGVVFEEGIDKIGRLPTSKRDSIENSSRYTF